MDSILSISNKSIQLRLLCLFILISACSRLEKQNHREGMERAENKSVNKKVSVEEWGPTKPTKLFFQEESSKYGLNQVKSVHNYLVDLNHDKFPDLVVMPDFYSSPEFYLYNPKLSKFELLKDYPLAEKVHASFLAFFDFNKDQVVDMLMATLNQKTELKKNPIRLFKGVKSKKGVHFDEVKDAFGQKANPVSSISLVDLNLDGFIDIYVGNWFEETKGKILAVPDQVFYGNGQRFVEVDVIKDELKFNRDFDFYPNAKPTFGVSSCDVDQNGYPDIAVVNSAGFANKLLLNLENQDSSSDKSNRQLVDFAPSSGFDQDENGFLMPKNGGNGFFSLCFDYNQDGIWDFILGNSKREDDDENRDDSAILTGSNPRHFPPRYLRSEIYRNADGPETTFFRRAVILDFNNDGLDDFLLEDAGTPPMSRLMSFEQTPDHAFDDLSSSWGIDFLNPSGAVALDLNRDGKMDFISGQTNLKTGDELDQLKLFINTRNTNNGWLKLNLKPQWSNSDAFGAMISVKFNSTWKKIWHQPLYGHLPSQNDSSILIGLGHNKVKEIKVTWPFLRKDKVWQVTYQLPNIQNKEITLFENGTWKFGDLR